LSEEDRLSGYSQSVQNKLLEISRKLNEDINLVVDRFESILNSDFIQNDEQFRSQEERERYAILVLWRKSITRLPPVEKTIIPIGYSGVIKLSTTEMSTIYCLTPKQGGGTDFTSLVLRGSLARRGDNVNLFCAYTVKVGQGRDGTLFADTFTEFKNPKPINLTPENIIERLGFKRITISEVENNLSSVSPTGIVDRKDWRVIRGIITHRLQREREDGTELCNYKIVDLTVDKETRTTPDGREVPPGLTVWTSPTFMGFDVDSECDFCGPIIRNKRGEISMQAYLIIPVHAIEIGG